MIGCYSMKIGRETDRGENDEIDCENNYQNFLRE